MTKRRKKYQEKEEIRHPDSPEGLNRPGNPGD